MLPWKQDTRSTCPHGLEVYLVDGTHVRDHHDSDFSQGGNGYRYKWIPKSEIWIDAQISEIEWPLIVYHECVEVELMRQGKSYDEAHAAAKQREDRLRRQRPRRTTPSSYLPTSVLQTKDENTMPKHRSTSSNKNPHFLKAVKFFTENGGYRQRPGESKAVARRRSAESLARAEQYAFDHDWRVDWVVDPEPYEMGDAEDEMPKEVFGAVLYDAAGKQLDSLWSIGDPTQGYRRVVEAELALEAMP
jgi:hypothetical protein